MTDTRETGLDLDPRYDANGLITAVVTHVHTGETSGHILHVRDIRIDCDQDAIWMKAEPAGPSCHTGAVNCFYRRVTPAGTLERVE